MKPLRSLIAQSLILPVLLAGPPAFASATDDAQPAAAASGEAAVALPKIALSPSLLYQFLLAEIAGQRGQWATTIKLYRELAFATRDPRIIRRATDLALHARQLELALELARLWQSVDPHAAEAGQASLRLLAALGKFDELREALPHYLANEPLQIEQNLSHLNRLLARSPDRGRVRETIEAVTEPYLQFAEAHYARALAAFEARDPAAARAAIGKALALKPDWETAALLQVQLTEDTDAAMQTLGRFVAAYPQSKNARQAYARGLVTLKRFAEAREAFVAALELNPRHGDTLFAIAVLSLQLDEAAVAERYLHQLIDIGHVEADKARFYLGQIAEEAQRWDDARRWFAEVGSGEHYLPARLHGANIWAKQGNLAAARQHLKESRVDDDRERVQLAVGEAQLLREAAQLEAAYAVLIAALEQQPDQPELLYESALIAERLGRFDELEARLRRLIALQPDHSHALNALGYALADRKLQLGEARALIERALELSPNDPFILDSKGWVLFRQGETTAALDTLQRAFALRPDPEIAAHLGEVLWSLGRYDEAQQTWDKARRESPANAVLAETVKRLVP